MILLWVVVLLGLVLGFSQAFDRVRRLEHTVDELRRTIDRLTKRLDEGTEPRPGPAVRPVAKPIARYEPPSIRQRALEPQPPAPEKEVVAPAAAPEEEQVVAI